MTNSKKINQDKPTKKRQQVVDTPAQGYEIGLGNEAELAKRNAQPWAKWSVKPELKFMPALADETHATMPPESAIGQRIAYCRGQLDNLSVEALARYTKYFDPDGVSRTSILRYEAGETLPGARELRILCDALWVSLDWLFYGRVGSGDVAPAERHALDAIRDLFWSYSGKENLIGLTNSLAARDEAREVEKRQKWIHEARQPKPRE